MSTLNADTAKADASGHTVEFCACDLARVHSEETAVELTKDEIALIYRAKDATRPGSCDKSPKGRARYTAALLVSHQASHTWSRNINGEPKWEKEIDDILRCDYGIYVHRVITIDKKYREERMAIVSPHVRVLRDEAKRKKACIE